MAEHNAPSTAHPEGNKTGAFTLLISPLVSPPLRPVSTSPQLTAELVLQTCWFSQVRDHVSTAQWNRLRKHISRQAHYCCEFCGGRGYDWPVACRDVWHDDKTTYVQTLMRLIAVCPVCHAVKHLGLTEVHRHVAEAQAHLAGVNQWPDVETETSPAHVWTVREKRSQQPWHRDLS